MLTYFGFRGEFDFSPLSVIANRNACDLKNLRLLIYLVLKILLVPVNAWVEICMMLLDTSHGYSPLIGLFGTQKDLPICQEIQARLNNANVFNYAGKTSILELQSKLLKRML